MPHSRRNILATLLAIGVVATGCGRAPTQVAARPAPGVVLPPPPDPARLDAVFVLESGGPPPEDTVVTTATGRRRVIMLRRGAPDNSLFAVVTVADSALGDSAKAARPPVGDSLTITVKPRPGVYGIDLEIEGGRPQIITIALSYAVHFAAPAGARDRYGSDLDFEQALFVARLGEGGELTFLPTTRQGSDLISATVPGPGRYLVAAPR